MLNEEIGTLIQVSLGQVQVTVLGEIAWGISILFLVKLK